MPHSIVLDLIEAVVEVISHFGDQGESHSDRRRRPSREDEEQRVRVRAIAAADLLILAAHHDGEITEAERTVLSERIPAILVRAGLSHSVEEHEARWSQRVALLTDEGALRAEIARVAAPLSQRAADKVFEAIVALARANAESAPGEGPFRGGRVHRGDQTVRLFGEVLRIDASEIDREARRVASVRTCCEP